MGKRKLLIIGAGVGQINIANMAKEMNLYVICVTPKGDWPVVQIADEVWDFDIYDKERILNRAKEVKIDAVISDQNDLMMPTVSYIAENMGLPGNTVLQTMSYCNKAVFRDNCRILDIPSPNYMRLNRYQDFHKFNSSLPWIVKPVDSQSSIGVKKIEILDNVEEDINKAINASKTKEAILEEFFEGKELVCEGFIYKGKYYLLSFGDRQYFDLKDLMIPTQTLFPSNASEEIKNKIVSYETKMARYISPHFAIVHSEYLYDEETGEIRVVESALRGGGVFISSHLMPYCTGIDINRVLLNLALGGKQDIDVILKSKLESGAGYVCFYLKEGIVDSIEGVEELETKPFVKMIDISKIKEGRPTEKMTYKGARQGPILVTGKNREELDQNIKYVQRTLKIKVKNNEKIIDGIVWQ